MVQIIDSIRKELADQADPRIRESTSRFFKEEVTCYGLKTASVTALAKRYWKEVRQYPKEEVFLLCEELYRSGTLEESSIGSTWARALNDRFGPQDLRVFERWIDSWISNWAACDGLCNHAVGDYLVKYPEQIPVLRGWALSPNRWMRRAACVSLVVPARKGMFLEEVFGIAGLVLTDRDEMVQKGCGWLLKEASRRHTDEVFGLVMQHKAIMSRTMLRYAVELMPPDLKAAAMKRR